jgi:hypothetical protein
MVSITIGCTAVSFSYDSFTAADNNQITETVTVNGQTTTKTFAFTTSSATDTIPINDQNGDVVSASATWTVDGGGSAAAGPQTLSGCSTPPPSCPTGIKANVRRHYSGNGTPGSWSGTNRLLAPAR